MNFDEYQAALEAQNNIKAVGPPALKLAEMLQCRYGYLSSVEGKPTITVLEQQECPVIEGIPFLLTSVEYSWVPPVNQLASIMHMKMGATIVCTDYGTLSRQIMDLMTTTRLAESIAKGYPTNHVAAYQTYLYDPTEAKERNGDFCRMEGIAWSIVFSSHSPLTRWGYEFLGRGDVAPASQNQ